MCVLGSFLTLQVHADWLRGNATCLAYTESVIFRTRRVETAVVLFDSLTAKASKGPYLFSIDDSTWELSAGLLAQIKRRGIPFGVTPEWEFQYGRENGFEALLDVAEGRAEGLQTFRLFTAPGLVNDEVPEGDVHSMDIEFIEGIHVQSEVVSVELADLEKRLIQGGFRNSDSGLEADAEKSFIFVPLRKVKSSFELALWIDGIKSEESIFKLSAGRGESARELMCKSGPEPIRLRFSESQGRRLASSGGLILKFDWKDGSRPWVKRMEISPMVIGLPSY
jgi:hypothetical protein